MRTHLEKTRTLVGLRLSDRAAETHPKSGRCHAVGTYLTLSNGFLNGGGRL
jgi:hypothetical protein